MNRMILGIGTARSGTMSLARLLQAQGLDVGHEDTTSVPWDVSRKPARFGRLKRELESRDGEVACWLTQAAPRLLEEFSHAKVIALHRPKDDTVQSLLAHMAGLRIRSDRPFGPMVFPTYTDRDLKAGWEAYWHDYQQAVNHLTEKWPERVLRIRTYRLEDGPTQNQIADFLSIPDWQHVDECHHNRRVSQQNA
jgi:hypothetical protein